MRSEGTLAIIKPDGVRKGLINEIQQRYQNAGLTIVRQRQEKPFESTIEAFYEEHRGRDFFDGLVLSMKAGPCVFMLLDGTDAIALVRKLNGATDRAKAEPGTIRHDFPSAGGPFNIVHGSDSPESAAREIKILFDE